MLDTVKHSYFLNVRVGLPNDTRHYFLYVGVHLCVLYANFSWLKTLGTAVSMKLAKRDCTSSHF